MCRVERAREDHKLIIVRDPEYTPTQLSTPLCALRPGALAVPWHPLWSEESLKTWTVEPVSSAAWDGSTGLRHP